MSTITPTLTMPQPADPDWVPEPLGRLTLDQYEAMVESGILTARDRMMLINGCLVEKMTHSPPHAVADELLRRRAPTPLAGGLVVADSQAHPDP